MYDYPLTCAFLLWVLGVYCMANVLFYEKKLGKLAMLALMCVTGIK